MAHDPRQFRPADLCRLLNSTPLGEVIKQRQMQEQRVQAGLRIGTDSHVDLFKYVAWLVQKRHLRTALDQPVQSSIDPAELALDAALAINGGEPSSKLTAKQLQVLAAILSEPTLSAAADKTKVSRMTVYRWLKTPAFQNAYQRVRQHLLNSSVGRLQLGTGSAVDAILSIVARGRRDSDRLRAAALILDHGYRGVSDQDLLMPRKTENEESRMDTTDVVQQLSRQLHRLEHASMPASEKTRLTATIADSLLRALTTDVIDKRLEAVQTVLSQRKKRS